MTFSFCIDIVHGFFMENCPKKVPFQFEAERLLGTISDMDLWMHFGRLLAPFWLPFGALLAPFGSLWLPLGFPFSSLWLPFGTLWLAFTSFFCPWLTFLIFGAKFTAKSFLFSTLP